MSPTESPSWDKAKVIAAKIGNVPSLFSSAIRTISRALERVEDETVHREKAVNASYFLVNISPSLKTLFYFAAEIYHPEELNQHISKNEQLNTRRLLTLFKPREIAAILGLMFLTRRIKRVAAEKEWKLIVPKMTTHMHISALVGDTIKYIGIGNGMLLGGMRCLSFLMLSFEDMKAFQHLRRKLNDKGEIFNRDEETKLWGYSHLQVASIISQSLGYGTVASMGFGLDYNPPVESMEHATGLDEKLLCWQAAIAWSESFHATGAPPAGLSEGDPLYLPEDEAKPLSEKVSAALDDPTKFNWLFRSQSELPKNIAEQLQVPVVSGGNGAGDSDSEELAEIDRQGGAAQAK